MRNRKRRREASCGTQTSSVLPGSVAPRLSTLLLHLSIFFVLSSFQALSRSSPYERQSILKHYTSKRRWPILPSSRPRLLAFDGPPQLHDSTSSSSVPPPTDGGGGSSWDSHAKDTVRWSSCKTGSLYPSGGEATTVQPPTQQVLASAFNGNGNGQTTPSATTTPVSSVPRLLDFISVYKNGTTVHRQLRKSDLALVLGCPTRDLRLIDASFPGNYAAFLSRRSAILLCVERVKAVIKRDEVMVFDPQSKEVVALVPLIQQQIAAATNNNNGGKSPPFEHLILEAVLGHMISTLRQRLQLLTPPVARILADLKFQNLGLNAFQNRMDELLPLRNALSELHSSVQELRKAMDAILMSDEDMALMYLTSTAETGRGRRLDQHQEVELLFENYLMQLEWVDAEIKDIQHAIQNTGETVEIQLDLLRNRILRFELILNMVSVVVGMGALVTGVFGMNLLSGVETHPAFFYTVTSTIATVMLAILGGALIYAIRGKLI